MNENINIQHACNGGEYSLNINRKRYKVDGYCKETNKVYQFHGCFYHGCNKCYNELTVNQTSGTYMYKLYEKTIRIDDVIRSAGYNLETIWEHDFDQNKEMLF
jgi:G:T-mismatch repair DNA endonuclease (very short patch repair protein)